jgi:4'-phosphopantetheinyl transferase
MHYLETFEISKFMISNSSEKNLMEALNWLSSSNDDLKVAWFLDDGSIALNATLQFLSPVELAKASELNNSDELRHFTLRRAFQRCFIKSVISFKGPLSEVPITHIRDAAPHCTAAPNLSLSFSSSGSLAVAASSKNFKIGVDIESLRTIPNSLALAQRFFSHQEIAHLKKLSPESCEATFLKLWTIKEACLKAAGKGIVYGPEKFIVGSDYQVDPPQEFGTRKNWTLNFPNISPNHLATIATYSPN